VEPPEFVRRLAPDPTLARRAAFALFVLAYLEASGLAPGGERYDRRVENAAAVNSHLFAPFVGNTAPLAELDPSAAEDLSRWARAQHLEREEPQVAYELGLLALGVALPPVLVRSLRDLELKPQSRVVELPDGAGYPTVFLGTMHTHWHAAENCTLLVTSTDARQLAAWALLLLTRRLEPRAGAIVALAPGAVPAAPAQADFALLYNTPPDLDPHTLVRAARFVVV
jgi:hypothetical protein